METQSEQIYTLMFDGGSTGNPGPSGSGSVLYENDEEIWCDSHYIGDRETNNTAEYTGLIRGLEEIVDRGITRIVIKGDSQLIIKQMKGEYKVSSAHLQILHRTATNLANKIDSIEWKHIPREQNKRADALSRIRSRPFCK